MSEDGGNNNEESQQVDDDSQLDDNMEEEDDKLDTDTDETLINLVKKHPILYNAKSSNNKNAVLKDSTWAQIGKSIGLTGAACKLQWQVLRSAYRRQKIKKPKSGDARKKNKPWPHFKAMEFLNEHIVDRKTKTNMPDEEEELLNLEDSNDPIIGNQPEVEGPRTPASEAGSTSSSIRTTSTTPSAVNKRKLTASDKVEEEIMSILKRPKQEMDQSYHFCMSLAQKMRALEPRDASKLQMKISELVYKIEYPYDLDPVM